MTVDFAQQVTQYASEIQSAAIQAARKHNEEYVQDTDTGGNSGQLASPYQNGGLEQYYADIPSLFQPFSRLPDPAGYQPLIDTLETAMGLLRVNAQVEGIDLNDKNLGLAGPEFQSLAGGASTLANWNGVAAQNFKIGYLSPFPSYTQNQFILIAVLRSAVEAQQRMWTEARKNILDIAAQTLNALDNYGYSCGPQSTMLIAFSVLTAIVSVAAAVPTVGASLPAAPLYLTAIGALGSLAGTVTPLVTPPDQQPATTGETAAQITDTMKAALNTLSQKISTGQDTMNSYLAADISTVATARSKYFDAPRPAVADQGPGAPDQG